MPVRRSFLVANCSPLYHKAKRLFIYAVDKAIMLRYPEGERLLTAHTDTIVGLYFAADNPSTFVSFGLDGRIIHWDFSTSEPCKKHCTGLPIFFADGTYLGQQSKTQYILKEYDEHFENATEIFRSQNPFILASGGSKNLPFLAIARGLELSVYWKSLRLLARYGTPWSISQRKSITCVAAHPMEAVVATGNEMGEIFIWWGLATKLVLGENPLDQLNPAEDDDDDSEIAENSALDDPFDSIRDAVVDAYNKGHPITIYPVHPSRVKRNSMHWHCCSVTAVCFTPSGSHLLSGGLEGVMVKWDLIECFGGPRHRRFLPRLGAPVNRLSSPGSHCEDAIMVTLENNSFHVLSGSLTPIYSHQGYIQMPRVWSNRYAVANSGSQVPTNLLVIPNKSSIITDSAMVLTNAGLGALQVVDPRAARSEVNKIGVTHQYAVPRPSDPKIPVAYSEVLLVANVLSLTQTTSSHWLVTYERMAPSAFKVIDDQARLTWWRYTPEECQVPKFEPIDSVSLSYLNSTATDLGFVPSKAMDLYMLLEDFRLCIWRANPTFDQFPSYYAPWLMHSCVQLNDPILPKNVFTESSGSPRITVIPIAAKREDNFEASPIPDQPDQFMLLITERTKLALYSLASLLNSGPVYPITSLELNNCNYVSSLPTETPFNEVGLRSVVDRPLLVNGVSSTSDQSLHCLALAVRGRINQSHKLDRVKKTTVRSPSFCLLCLVEISSKCSFSVQLAAVHWERSKMVACICAHDSQPLVAMGLADGTVALSEVCAETKIGNRITTIRELQHFPSLPAHPLCDRKALHRGGRQKRGPKFNDVDVTSIRNTTRILRLTFLTGKSRELVGLMETIFGRQKGRRDLILYGKPQESPLEYDISAQPVARNQPSGLLRLVAPAPIATHSLPAVAPGRKRTSSNIDDALRQVSHYPIATAPPPEQLLRQLMQENNPHM